MSASGVDTDLTVRGDGNVGIGATNPLAPLHVFRPNYSEIRSETASATDYATARIMIPANSSVADNAAAILFQEGSGTFAPGNRFWSFGFDPALDSFTIRGGDGVAHRLLVSSNGRVGIGFENPGSMDATAKLDVNGNIHISGNINAKYQDVAEWVPSTEELLPGTVVTVSASDDNHVVASSSAYDTAIAGVVSAKPGILLGERFDNSSSIATTGRVKVRVDATHVPIHRGDLLVASDSPGMAMKSEPVTVAGQTFHRPGTILGKALQSLERGRGEILVLLTLQ